MFAAAAAALDGGAAGGHPVRNLVRLLQRGLRLQIRRAAGGAAGQPLAQRCDTLRWPSANPCARCGVWGLHPACSSRTKVRGAGEEKGSNHGSSICLVATERLRTITNYGFIMYTQSAPLPLPVVPVILACVYIMKP